MPSLKLLSPDKVKLPVPVLSSEVAPEMIPLPIRLPEMSQIPELPRAIPLLIVVVPEIAERVMSPFVSVRILSLILK
jgi:hypothetical protein